MNEARNLGWVLRRLPAWVDELVIVDGRSTDNTVEVARSIRPDVVVVHERKPGKGAAVRAGFAAATGDIVVMLDGDGSMDPYEIDRFVQAIHDGADLAKGSRRIDGGGSADLTLIRGLGNRGLLLAANLLLGTAFSELCYGFMALRSTSIDALQLRADGFEIETEIVARAVRVGHTVVEVPSFESPRRFGESNLNAIRDGLRIVRTLLQVRTGIDPFSLMRRRVPRASSTAPAVAGPTSSASPARVGRTSSASPARVGRTP
jgi:glycosyltransferase involved in cell wall biosynthesis